MVPTVVQLWYHMQYRISYLHSSEGRVISSIFVSGAWDNSNLHTAEQQKTQKTSSWYNIMFQTLICVEFLRNMITVERSHVISVIPSCSNVWRMLRSSQEYSVFSVELEKWMVASWKNTNGKNMGDDSWYRTVVTLLVGMCDLVYDHIYSIHYLVLCS